MPSAKWNSHNDGCGPAACWRPRRRPDRVRAGHREWPPGPGAGGSPDRSDNSPATSDDAASAGCRRACTAADRAGAAVGLGSGGRHRTRSHVEVGRLDDDDFQRVRMQVGRLLYSSIASMPLSRFTTHLARSTIPRRSIAPYNCGGLADQIGSAILYQNHPMVVTGARCERGRSSRSGAGGLAPNGRRWLTLAIGDAVKLAKLKAGRTTKTDWPIGRHTTIA